MCFRGSNFNPFVKLKVGDVGPAKQFFSISLSQDAAFGGKYKIIVIAEPGAKAAYIEELAAEKFRDQKEMLFDKDALYELLYSKTTM